MDYIQRHHFPYFQYPPLHNHYRAALAQWSTYRIMAVPLKTSRVGQRCTLNLTRAETSSRWCGVGVRRGAVVPTRRRDMSHSSSTIDLLKDTFSDRLISRFGPVNWPLRSCDLTPLDYFLWGYVKSLVYADKPHTLGHLEDNIRRVIADIRPQMLEKVIENWTSRLGYIRASRGSPMPGIIFKM
ncbi:putative LOC100569746 [Trichonephila clavipes]|nr:putative LOC100569746 [Trichonephila clavipes]